MAYTITLDETDVATLGWARGRYGWGDFPVLDVGTHEIPEHEMWAWRDAVDSDTEGDHSPFPCLDLESSTGEKLIKLYDSII